MAIKVKGIIDALDIQARFHNACISEDHSSIRVLAKMTHTLESCTKSWDFFDLNEAGVCLSAPRGFAKTYKGYQIINLERLPPMTSVFGRRV